MLRCLRLICIFYLLSTPLAYNKEKPFRIDDASQAKMELQPDATLQFVKEHNPELIALPPDEYRSRFRAEVFDFLRQRRVSEFQDFFDMGLGPFNDSNLPKYVPTYLFKPNPAAQYYYVVTNFWKLIPNSSVKDAWATDAYIFLAPGPRKPLPVLK